MSVRKLRVKRKVRQQTDASVREKEKIEWVENCIEDQQFEITLNE